jgi:hypothetical protein
VNGSCIDLPGATSSTVVVIDPEVGFTLRVVVVATGPGGSRSATSEETVPVTEAVTRPGTNCINSLGACGYPDPTTGNVGPGVSCSSLTPAGGLTISTPGTTIQGMNITGPVIVNASNVTLSHDCITSNGGGQAGSAAVIVERGATNAQILYSNVSGANASSGSVEEAIRTNYANMNTTADHDYISDCGECFHGPGTLTNSYVIANASINPGQSNEDHYEDIYYGGGGGPLIVNHNTMLNPHNQTAVVFASVDFGDQTTLSITNNLMAGGDYVLYGGGSGGGGSVIGPVTVTGNRISRKYYPNGAQYGVSDEFVASVTSWSGNIWDDTLAPVQGP